jgi:hypothetical protein
MKWILLSWKVMDIKINIIYKLLAHLNQQDNIRAYFRCLRKFIVVFGIFPPNMAYSLQILPNNQR